MGETKRINYVVAEMRARRRAKGWSQGQLGTKAGFALQQVNRWEGGYNFPSIEKICNCLQALGCHLEIVED